MANRYVFAGFPKSSQVNPYRNPDVGDGYFLTLHDLLIRERQSAKPAADSELIGYNRAMAVCNATQCAEMRSSSGKPEGDSSV